MLTPSFKFQAIYSKSSKFVLKNHDRLQIPGLIKELQPSIQNQRTSFQKRYRLYFPVGLNHVLI